eukprot:3482881-Amphidinium_carterae.2
MLTKAVILETLQRLRPIMGLTAFGKPGTTTNDVSAVSITKVTQPDQRLRARALACSELDRAYKQRSEGESVNHLIAVIGLSLMQGA